MADYKIKDPPTHKKTPSKKQIKTDYRGLIVYGIILILLAVTNPSDSDFKSYVGRELGMGSTGTTIALALTGYSKSDYIVCSVYTINVGDQEARFLGLLKGSLFRLANKN